jgi:hypothetical protein
VLVEASGPELEKEIRCGLLMFSMVLREVKERGKNAAASSFFARSEKQ